MTDVTAQSLDPLILPLYGERLIEASAGTGKTFTIAALYLRLLLGLGGTQAFPRPLSVEELLVVTFTEAATEELRGRIRANIHALRIACIRNHTRNPLLVSLLEQISDKSLAARTLLLAEQQMDEAAIFTIHGFCQRMLSLNAFESGMLFEQQLLEDEARLRRQACADFWRRHCYPLPKEVALAVSEQWSGPDALLRDIHPWLQGEAPGLKASFDADETLVSLHNKIIATINTFKQQWRLAAGELQSLIEGSGVDKRSYSSKHLPNWLAMVDDWANCDTLSYQLPEALKKFSQNTLAEKTKKGEVPSHHLFVAVDCLLAEPLTLRTLVITRALQEIRDQVQQEKARRGELGFDDMLSRLDSALHQPGGENLASSIRQRFPVAMIDEFQDTDPQQYRIFRCLYLQQPLTGLLLIGDPKQAIYAFRGADIFTYIQARKEITAHYTLETNWRSSPAMVAAVNRLFEQVDAPFLFEQIPFLPVKSAPKNSGSCFTLRGETQPALKFWLQSGDGAGVSDYQQAMAMQCARQIRDWLSAGQQEEALLWHGDKSRAVQASDITVLVRSRHEATIIRDALRGLNIPSVYLSSRDSVFSTAEARELLWILQAVLTPEVESSLRSALATSMLGLDARTLDALNQDENEWDKRVEEFLSYRQLWSERGVMPMLRALITAWRIAENLLATPAGERRLTDILHISELLQEASLDLESEHALVRWLGQNIAEPDNNAASQQLRLESDKHLVNVVTIHKSKGLEYSLVWIPFAANYRQQQSGIYHDRSTYVSQLDLSDDEESLRLVEEERLAEDLRLLYVALTRSIWHCSIGVAPLFRGSRAKKGVTDVHLSALGYLIQQGAAMDAAGLTGQLKALADGSISVENLSEEDNRPWEPLAVTQPVLAVRYLNRPVADNWRVTSYSGLQQRGRHSLLELMPRLDVDAAGDVGEQNLPALTAHNFPRGASPGTFLHNLFENIDFNQPVDSEWVAEQLRNQGISGEWQQMMTDWLTLVLNVPLNQTGVSLQQLMPKQRHAELEFYLPIVSELQADRLDRLIRKYDPLSADCPPLDFRGVKGMLKGFIDLIFCWQGKYYLLDYKSNWLGEDSNAYSQQAMEQAMKTHRYDLQYQLYTLAVHRYLGHRLAGYDYQQHFGGVIYLFLRGVDKDSPGQGIFTMRPDPALIEAMDNLFAGNRAEVA